MSIHGISPSAHQKTYVSEAGMDWPWGLSVVGQLTCGPAVEKHIFFRHKVNMQRFKGRKCPALQDWTLNVQIIRKQHRSFPSYCDIHPRVTDDQRNNVGQGLDSMHRLLIGLWNVDRTLYSKTEADKPELAVVGFKRTKWFEKSCIRHLREVCHFFRRYYFFFFSNDTHAVYLTCYLRNFTIQWQPNTHN